MNGVIKQILKTFLFGTLIFILSSFYLFLRRGDYSWYIANKAIATAALFLLGLSFALGSFYYLFNCVNNKLIYRKWLGIWGFIFAGVHILITEIFLFGKFKGEISIIFGIIAFVLFLIMFFVSSWIFENRMAISVRMRIFRYLGNAGFLFVAAHLSLLKYKEWLKWFKTFDPAMPPLSLLGIIFAAFVVSLQVAAFLKGRFNMNADKRALTRG